MDEVFAFGEDGLGVDYLHRYRRLLQRQINQPVE
jgi:hypothetical protein